LAIDTGRSGTHCVIAGETPLLWRAKVGNPSSLSLKNRKSKARVNVTWPAGSETIAWPAGVPAEDGATYLARFKNHPSASKIVLHLVPGGMPTAYHQAAWMADHGCTVQGRALLSATD
jgi:hypothetical protein